METEFPAKVDLPKKAYIGLRDVPLVRHLSSKRCGFYTAEWIARAIGLHPVPFNKIITRPVWRDIFHPVFPRDMMSIFKLRGMDSVAVNLSKFSDIEKINWIKREVALKRKSPALLVRTKTLHWIAVCGYDDDKKFFYVYDSHYGSSSINPYYPIGNTIVMYDELSNVWSGRWWLKYRAIVITTDGFKEPEDGILPKNLIE